MPMNLRANPPKKELFEEKEAQRPAKRVKTLQSTTPSPVPSRKGELFPQLASRRPDDSHDKQASHIALGHNTQGTSVFPRMSHAPILNTHGGTSDSSTPTETLRSGSGETSPSTATTIPPVESLDSPRKLLGVPLPSRSQTHSDLQANMYRDGASKTTSFPASNVNILTIPRSLDPVVSSLEDTFDALQEMAFGQPVIRRAPAAQPMRFDSLLTGHQSADVSVYDSPFVFSNHALQHDSVGQSIQSSPAINPVSQTPGVGRDQLLPPKGLDGDNGPLTVAELDGFLALANGGDVSRRDSDFDVEPSFDSERMISRPSTPVATIDGHMRCRLEGIVAELEMHTDHGCGLEQQPSQLAEYQRLHRQRFAKTLKKCITEAPPKVNAIMGAEQANITRELYKIVEHRLVNTTEPPQKPIPAHSPPIPAQRSVSMFPIKPPAGFKAIHHPPGRPPPNSIPAHYFQTFPNLAPASATLRSNTLPLPKLAPKPKRSIKLHLSRPSEPASQHIQPIIQPPQQITTPVQPTGTAPVHNYDEWCKKFAGTPQPADPREAARRRIAGYMAQLPPIEPKTSHGRTSKASQRKKEINGGSLA